MTTSAATVRALLERARAWAAEDPDPQTRAELERSSRTSRPAATPADLADRFDGHPGVRHRRAARRARRGPEPDEPGRGDPRRGRAGGVPAATRAPPAAAVVIGYDARHNSDVFARDTAEVMTRRRASRPCVLPRPLPTPAARLRDPRARLRRRGDGDRQPQPAAGQRLQGLPRRRQPDRAAGRRARSPRGSPPSARSPTSRAATGGTRARRGHRRPLPRHRRRPGRPTARATSTSSTRRCTASAAASVRPGAGDAPASRRRTSSTAAGAARPGLPDRGLPQPRGARRDGPRDGAGRRASTPTWWSPTTRTPTAAPPRCPAPHGWRMLRGDEVGALLGPPPAAPRRAGHLRDLDRVLLACSARWRPPPGSRTPRRSPASSGSAGSTGLAFGYEEALGYCVDPEHVKDKDGVSALLLLVRARRAGQGRRAAPWSTVLDDLAREHGLHATDQLSVRVTDLAAIAAAMERLRGHAADRARRAGRRAGRRPRARAAPTLPPTDGLRYRLADQRAGRRAPERHRAQAQVLPRGRRPGATPSAASRPAASRPPAGWTRSAATSRRPPASSGRRTASQVTSETTNSRHATSAADLGPGPDGRASGGDGPLLRGRAPDARSRALVGQVVDPVRDEAGVRRLVPLVPDVAQRSAARGDGPGPAERRDGGVATAPSPRTGRAACRPPTTRSACRPPAPPGPGASRPVDRGERDHARVAQHVAQHQVVGGRRRRRGRSIAAQTSTPQHERAATNAQPEPGTGCHARPRPPRRPAPAQRPRPATSARVGWNRSTGSSRHGAPSASVPSIVGSPEAIRSPPPPQPYAGPVTRASPPPCLARDDAGSVPRPLRGLLRRDPAPTPRCAASCTGCPASTRSAPRPAPPRSAPARSRPRPRRSRIDLAIRMVDLTTLEGQDTPGKVRALAAKAMRPDPADPTCPATAAVCVYPDMVATAKEALGGSGVHVAAVATAFPSRPRGAGHQARRHPRRRRGRRRRDRHGHRPRRVPVRPLPRGLRGDRRGPRGLLATAGPPQGDLRDRRAADLRQRAPGVAGWR